MTLEALFTAIATYRIPILLFMLATPPVTYLICYCIPGRREEPFLLSANLSLSVVSMLLLVGYLAYATNTGGWQKVVSQADVRLLLLPPLHLALSLWFSRLRLPLEMIPAFRSLQGLMLIAIAFLIVSWLASRIYVVFFSYLPFGAFLWLLAIVLGVGYIGFRKLVG